MQYGQSPPNCNQPKDLAGGIYHGRITVKKQSVCEIALALTLGIASAVKAQEPPPQEELVPILPSQQQQAPAQFELGGNNSDFSTRRLQPPPPHSEELAVVPSVYWNALINRPLFAGVPVRELSLEQALLEAIQKSPQVQVYMDAPLIRETSIVEARAAFDWKRFVETKWNDVNEPVGSTLITGGPDRLNDHHWTFSGGQRRTNEVGGRTQISQDFGHQNTNSVFFVPKNQGTSRLTLGYTQPILKGGGKCYNSKVTLLASIDTEAAQHELTRQLETHLLDVSRAFWLLELERGNVAQKRASLQRGRELLLELEQRRELDAVESQILRGQAVVAMREADLFRAENAIKNAEGRLKSLIGDETLETAQQDEVVPLDPLVLFQLPISAHESRQQALENRPELKQAMSQIRAGSERLEMARHEIMPTLDLVLQTYVSGLDGNSDIPRAFTEQFDTGAPSYSAGVVFEVPVGNRAATTRRQRRELELRQLTNQFRATVQTVVLEVDIATREVNTAFQEVLARHKASLASEAEVQYLDKRWREFISDNSSGATMLNELFQAQDRLVQSEYAELNALVTYNLAIINLKKVTGTLLQQQGWTTEPLPNYQPGTDTPSGSFLPEEQSGFEQGSAR